MPNAKSQVDPNKFRQEVAYVMQEDIMHAHQTPREAFRFSAKLRLPENKTVEERTELVEWMIRTLGLSSCADTKIGSIKVPGISGGEKKRTAIGIELVSAPRLLFLDEPTSGLDSYAAFNVVKVLTQLCSQGTTIIATIHQVGVVQQQSRLGFWIQDSGFSVMNAFEFAQTRVVAVDHWWVLLLALGIWHLAFGI